MKKLYTLLVIALIGFVGNAQIVNIPDANFKAKLLQASPTNQIASTQTPNASGQVTTYSKIDTNNDGEIQVSEALAIKWLNVQSSSIADLTGIESFMNLQFLKCDFNQLTSVNISGLTILKILDCSENQLTDLNVSGLTNLQDLDCDNNELPSLDLSGLTNLENLHCGGNGLTSLNVSGLSNLQYLVCSLNLLPSLNVSGLTNLQYLDCHYNLLPSLNVSGLTNLQVLLCNNNQLPSLNVSGLTNLQRLSCNDNQLPSLNVSGLSNLQYLVCNDNLLSSLNVSGLSNLKDLYCGDNLLPSLDLSGLTNLENLQCWNNQLPSLDLSGLTNLEYLQCWNNQLPSLNVSGLSNLKGLYCGDNLLPSIDVSGLTNLLGLNCSFNQLTSLDVSGLTNLQSLNCGANQLITLFLKNGRNENFTFNNNPNLQYICADEGQLASIQSQITQYGYTNCNVNSYCSFTPGGAFYTIQGNNRYDSNSNGCDASDSYLPNLKCAITDGTTSGTFISNTTGSYTIPVHAGTHTVTPIFENPSYFSVSPATVSVLFPTTASPFTQDFCVAPNGVHHDLEVSIIPLLPARPGFDATYKIVYKNKGNQLESGSISLEFEDDRIDLVLANPIVSNQVLNMLTWDYTNLQPFESREITLTLNVNSPMETPAVNIGDQLDFTAIVNPLANDEIVADNTSSLKQIVVGSYDPNDKTCIEGTTISPSMVGNYVHYVIRFENTGTFAAQNVVIKDMIDTTKFDMASLIPQSSSHSFVTRITNTNQVEFIFENINLPFDDANNDGYVAFKIKTKPTLVLGNTFTNTASIYFDYNFPIVTNTTTTTVATLGNQDFDFGSVFTLSPVPAKNSLTITTKQDVVVSSVNIYNTLGQLVQVNTNPNETIDISSLQSGSYFVRITSDKGSATGKFLKE
jgi:Leucine-rich repeat (LRR) protein